MRTIFIFKGTLVRIWKLSSVVMLILKRKLLITSLLGAYANEYHLKEISVTPIK